MRTPFLDRKRNFTATYLIMSVDAEKLKSTTWSLQIIDAIFQLGSLLLRSWRLKGCTGVGAMAKRPGDPNAGGPRKVVKEENLWASDVLHHAKLLGSFYRCSILKLKLSLELSNHYAMFIPGQGTTWQRNNIPSLNWSKGRLMGLSMSHSRLGYGDWTNHFQNQSQEPTQPLSSRTLDQ